ncbi:M1 family aminopeptidase [Hymenobacter rubripertinctus]|uniref:Aminopeptidase N n=1 Tax=Hymenobacter rubripertinctus TaxID=2029981 RepID=A0A418QLS8_9BACT|nr:M1 family aminopeptidase [Hymenobacter rubripertinctus]RIY06213.1 T9SS C-terminal target domain-containing protein [Hymenobacter rubripertinctus]
MRILTSLLVLGGLLAGAAQAQVPTYRPLAADLDGSAAEACARAHMGPAVARPAYASLGHRQKMARYDVKYYKLDLRLANNARTVGGVVTMRAQTGAQALDSLAFELYATYTIDSVVVDGRRSRDFTRRALGDVTVGLGANVAPNTLFSARIYYRGTAPNGNAAAIGNALNTRVDSRYGVSTTWSLSEPYNAYEWWPCKQTLTDKADSSDVWVTTAATNKVGSNGVLERVTSLPGNEVRYEWKSRHPIAYYLISVAVGPYAEYINYANPTGGPRIPVVNYVYNQAALNFYRTEIDRTPGFIENFSDLVGLYPFANEKYGHSMAPIGGGMEHQTMTTQDGFNFTLTAHELFHQWFGDNVTCGAWEDIWLNESFASYGEYLSLNRFSSAGAARDWMNNAHFSAMNQYVNAQWVPAPGGSLFVSDTTSVSRIFSSRLSYKKGAAVVHMLRYVLNDDTRFFRALRTYQSTYGGRTARTRDLQRIFEAEAGRSLQYFFDQWFRGEGFPSFAVRWNQANGQVYIQNTQTTSMPTVTPYFDTEVDYRLTFTDGTSRTLRLRQYQLVVSAAVAESRVISSLEVDPDQWLLNGTGSVQRDAGLVTASRPSAAQVTLRTYPNPCHDQLRLADFNGSRAQAEVTDATGRVVLRQTVLAPAPVLRTGALAPGIYHLRLLSPDGSVAQARFVRGE